MNQTLYAHLAVVLATFLIALSFIISAKLSGVIDPISLTLYRFVFASIVLAPIIFFKQKYRIKIKQSFKKAMIISFFYALYFIGLFKALEYTSALNTATLFTLTPLITAIFAVCIFKQHISLAQFIVYLVGIVGTCLVVFKGDLALFLTFSLNHGDIIFLFALIFMSLYSISAKYLYQDDDEVLTLTFMTLVGGCFWMAMALGILHIPLGWDKIEGELFLYIVYLSIGATLLTVYLYQKATVTIGPKNITAYIYINPTFAAMILFVFEGVNLSFGSIVGILLSLVATVILLVKE
ncbi:MAG: DMT family transporter [Epsilonproteobacteria bacterium]|nr:DMT family transporter [Campylobacterota bacterium]